MRERNWHFDNYKAFLIWLVVLGHFLLPLRKIYSGEAIYVSCMWIYLFHMPAFVFVSGYFCRSYIKKGRDNRRLLGFLVLYTIFKILLWCQNCIREGALQPPNLLEGKGAPWYLMAMFCFYLLISFISEFKARYTLPLSLILALILGMEKHLDNFMYIPMVIFFMPFFLLGCYFDYEKAKQIITKKRLLCNVTAVLFLIAAAAAIHAAPESVRALEGQVYGTSTYSDMGINAAVGILSRIAYYVLACLMAAAIFCLTPTVKLPLSFIGSRTLAIYIGHTFIRRLLLDLEIFRFFEASGAVIVIAGAVISSIIVVGLSWKPLTDLCNKAFRIG